MPTLTNVTFQQANALFAVRVRGGLPVGVDDGVVIEMTGLMRPSPVVAVREPSGLYWHLSATGDAILRAWRQAVLVMDGIQPVSIAVDADVLAGAEADRACQLMNLEAEEV